jgi:histone-lysine N-methyltransferase SETMAR
LHDIGPAHRALAAQKKLAYLGCHCLGYPLYSPELAPSDYHLSLELKKKLKGRHFSSDAEVTAAAETWLDGQRSEFFVSGLQKLEQRAEKCIELRAECVA